MSEHTQVAARHTVLVDDCQHTPEKPRVFYSTRRRLSKHTRTAARKKVLRDGCQNTPEKPRVLQRLSKHTQVAASLQHPATVSQDTPDMLRVHSARRRLKLQTKNRVVLLVPLSPPPKRLGRVEKRKTTPQSIPNLRRPQERP